MGSCTWQIYLTRALLIILTTHSTISAENRFHALAQKTRAIIKGWVYKGWVRNDNFFEIIPGELYRSSQLPPSRLESYIKQYGIKTIVNLSGDEPWYWVSTQEKQLAEKYKIVLFNIKTHALVVTPLEQVRSLLTISLSAPLPILFHCFAGSDRAGEACALYMLANGKGITEALSQLSTKFGHKKWLFPFKHYLIINMDKLYPNLLNNLQEICNKRFSYEILKNVSPENLYFKVLELNSGGNVL